MSAIACLFSTRESSAYFLPPSPFACTSRTMQPSVRKGYLLAATRLQSRCEPNRSTYQRPHLVPRHDTSPPPTYIHTSTPPSAPLPSSRPPCFISVPSVPARVQWHKVDEEAEDAPILPRSDAGPKGRPPRSYATERWDCPPLFRPVRIPSDPPDSDGVSLDELLAGEYTEAMVCSYLVDAEFLLQTAPRLKTVPFLLVQGIKDDK